MYRLYLRFLTVSYDKLPVAHGKLLVAHGLIPGKKYCGKIPVKFWYDSRIYSNILGLGKIP